MIRDRDFYRTLLRLSLPVALQGLMTLLVNTADQVMVSALGDAALSGVSMATSLGNFLTMLLLGLAAGATVLGAQYWGKRDLPRLQAVASVALQACFGVALVVSVALFCFSGPAIRLMTHYEDIAREGAIYLRVVAFSFLFYALTASLSALLRCVELVGVTFLASMLSLGVNVALNFLLISGRFGFPAMGVRGAALATLCARALEGTILLVYAFFVQRRVPLRLRACLRLDRRMWRDYARFGMPVALGDSQWAMIGVLKASIVGHLGPVMASANSVAEAMLSLVMIFSNSLTSGAAVMIGKSVGERDYAKTRRYSGTIQILFVFVGVVMCATVFLTRGLFVGFFGNLSGAARDLALQLIAVGAVTMLGTSYHAACFMGINRGAGDARFVFWVDLICGWVIVLPLSYLAAFVWKWPLPAVFLCIRVDQLFKWIIAFFRLRGDRWIRNVTQE